MATGKGDQAAADHDKNERDLKPRSCRLAPGAELTHVKLSADADARQPDNHKGSTDERAAEHGSRVLGPSESESAIGIHNSKDSVRR